MDGDVARALMAFAKQYRDGPHVQPRNALDMGQQQEQPRRATEEALRSSMYEQRLRQADDVAQRYGISSAQTNRNRLRPTQPDIRFTGNPRNGEYGIRVKWRF